MRLVFVLLLSWKMREVIKAVSKQRNLVITFDNHLKTSLKDMVSDAILPLLVCRGLWLLPPPYTRCCPAAWQRSRAPAANWAQTGRWSAKKIDNWHWMQVYRYIFCSWHRIVFMFQCFETVACQLWRRLTNFLSVWLWLLKWNYVTWRLAAV